MTTSLLCVLAAAIGGVLAQSLNLPHPCDSEIYCYGTLLHTVQMAQLYNDSKSFVDMSLKRSPQDTLDNFNELMQQTDGQPSRDEVADFVEMNFNDPGTEFIPWNPDDWHEDHIVDPELESWATTLHDLWKSLGRQISDTVKNEPEKFSQIYVPNPVIVPGGRFREFYYWDSYWTMEGLLLSEMVGTVKGMLENFIEMVNQYGMVPNGGRIYYSRRSQPPYLIPMVKLYVDHTGDLDFVREHIGSLEKEFEFWETNRSITIIGPDGRTYHLAKYNVLVGDPRPESYREDYQIAIKEPTETQKEMMYVELHSGAESGWDFSTRWFVRPNNTKGTLEDLNVTAIAPVDLNSLLCYNARLLSDFHRQLGNLDMAKKYNEIAYLKNETLAELFWDEDDGIWYDVNVYTLQRRKYFYLSNVHPIWSGAFGIEGAREQTVERVIDYLKKEKVIDYIGGVPTSLKDSGEQWDYPNAWAPLQHIVIMGLYNARNYSSLAEPVSYELAEKWVRSNWKGYKDTQAMFEKPWVNKMPESPSDGCVGPHSRDIPHCRCEAPTGRNLRLCRT